MNILGKYKKIVLYIGIFSYVSSVFAAGLNLSSEFPTHVQVTFTNNVTKEVDLYFGSLERIDAFFEGFRRIQWRGLDGKTYIAGLDIQGIENWIPVLIRKDNYILVQPINKRPSLIRGIES